MRISDWSSDVCSSDLLGLDVFTDDALQDVHTIVLSPGLSPLQEPIKSFLALAAARQIQVVGEIELFARALADMSEQGYQPKLLAVTGTNGKTTVTAMTRQRSEEHTSELQSLMRNSYAVFCLKKKHKTTNTKCPLTCI